MDPNKFQESTSFPALMPFVPHPFNRGCYIPVNPFYPEASYSPPEALTFDRPAPKGGTTKKKEPEHSEARSASPHRKPSQKKTKKTKKHAEC